MIEKQGVEMDVLVKGSMKWGTVIFGWNKPWIFKSIECNELKSIMWMNVMLKSGSSSNSLKVEKA